MNSKSVNSWSSMLETDSAKYGAVLYTGMMILTSGVDILQNKLFYTKFPDPFCYTFGDPIPMIMNKEIFVYPGPILKIKDRFSKCFGIAIFYQGQKISCQ